MPELDFYKELLQMRENYKNAPLKNIRLSHPGWLSSKDPMYEIYKIKTTLLQQGEIVYAHIVQANTILFHTLPPYDCPAQIVYSSDNLFLKNPEILRELAYGLYEYKGKEPDEVPDEWKDAVRSITDEYDRSGYTLFLNADGKSLQYKMIPLMIFRKLLPKRKLCGSLLPVLTLPEYKQVLILPKKYWTESFKNAWVAGLI